MSRYRRLGRILTTGVACKDEAYADEGAEKSSFRETQKSGIGNDKSTEVIRMYTITDIPAQPDSIKKCSR